MTNFEQAQETMEEIYEEVRNTNLSDLEFATLPEIEEKAFKIISLYEKDNTKTTYNNLTNMNNHILVKILNYNGFFDKELTKKLREELKTFSISGH